MMTKNDEDEFIDKLDEMCDGLNDLITEYEPKKEAQELVEEAIRKLRKAQGSL
jgi:hypothetical protein